MKAFLFSITGCNAQFNLKPFGPNLWCQWKLCAEEFATLPNLIQIIQLAETIKSTFNVNLYENAIIFKQNSLCDLNQLKVIVVDVSLCSNLIEYFSVFLVKFHFGIDI